jgi:two-component system phosphate regulon sensor histidine kinase PhoR
VSDETRVIILEAAPLLLLATLYLGVAASLAPAAWRERRVSSLGFGVWLLFVIIGGLAAALGGAKLDDADFLGEIDEWLIFGLALAACLPALIILFRWRERSLLVSAGRRVREAETQASERRRGAEAVSRLSTALTRTLSGREAADRLFDELESVLAIERALIATVDDEAGRAAGFAARGVEEEWWRGVTLDLERDSGAIVTVARERAPYAVYDVATAPNINRALADRVGAKSAAFVPLVSDGRITGVLVAATASRPRLFSAADLEVMQDLANETALALGRMHSDKALKAALDRERVVGDIARKVRSELDLDSVLQVAVAEVAEAVGVARCFIRLGESGEPMPILAEWDAPGFEPVGAAAPRLPVLNLAARERRTAVVGDIVTAPELDDPTLGGRETLLNLGTRAVLATPILVFDEMIGVFGMHRPEPTEWANGEVALAEAVAREVGLAIHTARLLKENTRRLDQQAALLKAAQVLTSDLRFDAVLRRLVDEVVRILGADAADCWIFDEERKLLRCHAAAGVPERNVGREIRPEGTFKQVIDSGRPALKREFATTEQPSPSTDYAVFSDVMDAPITWLGEVRGVLGVCSREAGRFDLADLEVLDTFARLASLALHNAESFGDHERQAQVQRGFYRVAEVLGSTLSLAETIDALAQAACDALGGTSALVLEPRGDRLFVAGSHELPEAVEEALAEGLEDGASPFGGAAREERILTATSLTDDDRFEDKVRSLLRKAGYRSLLCAPVTGLRGENDAVVVLFTDERSFSDDDLALARHLIGAARGALERSELFEAERRARGFSQRLAAIGGLLATKLDPEVALGEIAREAPALLAADAAVVRVLENDELAVAAAWGPATQGVSGTRASSAAGVAGVVAQSRSPLAVSDARETPRFCREDPLLDTAMASAVSVPMIVHGGSLYGVLSVYGRRARAWRDDEVQALIALAATASAAVSSADLYSRMAEEKERSEAILAHIADGIVAVDRDGLIVLWNAMAEHITGVPVEEALGRRVTEVLQRELATSSGEAPGQREISILRGGKEVWLSLTEAVMLDPAGSVAGRIFAFRDVSSERVVEQMKSDFVATVSHELRTPLTSIYGFAETLLRADIAFSDSERATFLGYIASESERLIGIVDDLLNVARLETGTVGLNVTSTDVGDVVEEVVARVRDQVDGRHTFAVDVQRGHLAVQADREKLAQILLNLVDNAIKFSPSGGQITVSARRRTDTAEVRVIDQGVGIARSDQQRIFTKFYRAEGVVDAGVQGAGLGLFLARGLLAAMGGRIWVESKEGEGSSFVFELPIARGAADADEDAPAEPLEPAGRSASRR